VTGHPPESSWPLFLLRTCAECRQDEEWKSLPLRLSRVWRKTCLLPGTKIGLEGSPDSNKSLVLPRKDYAKYPGNSARGTATVSVVTELG
jgi:hypothetical protein